MKNSEKTHLYSTSTHKNNELDYIFNQDYKNTDEIAFRANQDLLHELKIYWRLFRKNSLSFFRDKFQKKFTNIIYLTLDCPPYTYNSQKEGNPIEFITEMQKQYPENDIRILIPIINIIENQKLYIEIEGKTKELVKTNISFKFFLQNKSQSATIYKLPKNSSNIKVYGIYSPSFSNIKNISELSRLQYLAPFLKAARITIKKLSKEGFNPDIVHCENIPYYLGSEFEKHILSRTKVLQIIKDFTQIDVAKPEAFWATINLADKKAIKKICKDKVIKKLIANLFKLHNTKRFCQIKDCLNFIYKNYYKFRKYVDKGEDIEENIIFNRLNSRIIKLFPNIGQGENLYFNTMLFSLKKADFWVTVSKTYYKDIFENSDLSKNLFEQIEKTKTKSSYITLGCTLKEYPRENTRKIYQSFNVDNFRESRKDNKIALLKEFSIDRIKTNFVDPTLFKGENVKIYGSLESFYDTPLLFANTTSEIFANGVDILFNTILKLFELHKNIQVIICIKDGIRNNYVKNCLEYLSNNKYLNGKWVFIDGEINLHKFLAASDMILIPRRANFASIDHFVAMNYGCIPVASRSGILNDTISDIFDDISNGCGFKTKTNLLAEEDYNSSFLATTIKALNLYQNNPNSWNLLIKNCLNYNSNWNFKILEKYNEIYQKLI